jgi:hypothetical protein
MKTFFSIKELAADDTVPSVIREETLAFQRMLKRNDLEINDEQLDDLNYLSGGPICIVETAEDLKEIKTFEEHEYQERWLDITEKASTFDIACWVHKEKEWAQFWNATNNSGGTVYYVHNSLVYIYPSIQETIRLTNLDNKTDVMSIKENEDANNTD